MKIKKGNLNHDQSGRAYPDEPQIKENWDCIWEYKGKHYKLVGDDEHKEWEEVNIYNQIIDEVYAKYSEACEKDNSVGLNLLVKIVDGSTKYRKLDMGMFEVLIRHDKSFSERWGLTIEEEELGLDERKQIMIDKEIDYVTVNMFFNKTLDRPKQEMYEKTIPTKLITVIYNNETFEIYE
jgi:hypothetical protein